MKKDTPMTDKDKITDSLTSQKTATGAYNMAVNECATPELRNCLQKILAEEHTIGYGLFTEMNSRGWYPVEKADDNKLCTTKTKHQNC